MAMIGERLLFDMGVWGKSGSAEAAYAAEDFADRLSSIYSSAILSALCLVQLTRVYFFTAIACIMPTAPTGMLDLRAYMENICWITGTIALRSNETFPRHTADWDALYRKRNVDYYQWIPLSLAMQAILFHLPRLVLPGVSLRLLGFRPNNLVHLAAKAESSTSRKTRQDIIQQAAYQLYCLAWNHQPIRGREGCWPVSGKVDEVKKVEKAVAVVDKMPTADYKKSNEITKTDEHSLNWSGLSRYQGAVRKAFSVFGKRSGYRVAYVLILGKLIYLGNVAVQFSLLCRFLNLAKWYEVPSFLGDVLLGKRSLWHDAELKFPIHTSCRTSMRIIGSKDTVLVAHCALPFNVFNQRMYCLLFAWIAFVGSVTCLSLLHLIARFIGIVWFPHSTIARVQNWVSLSGQRQFNCICNRWKTIKLDKNENKLSKLIKDDAQFQIGEAVVNSNVVLFDETHTACQQTKPVAKRLSLLVQPVSYGLATKFYERYLRADGAFLLTLIIDCIGDSVAAEVATALWAMYRQDETNKQLLDTIDSSSTVSKV